MLKLTSRLSYGWWGLLCGLWLIYFLSPFDLVPEVVPVIGRLDDLIVLGGLYWLWKHWRSTPASSTHSQAGATQSESAQDSGQEDDPWQVLHLSSGATPEEIDTAYKAMLFKYHPDRVAHLGEELQDLAHRKTLSIQHAYTTLKARP